MPTIQKAVLAGFFCGSMLVDIGTWLPYTAGTTKFMVPIMLGLEAHSYSL
jgi:hypothetical protein